MLSSTGFFLFFSSLYPKSTKIFVWHKGNNHSKFQIKEYPRKWKLWNTNTIRPLTLFYILDSKEGHSLALGKDSVNAHRQDFDNPETLILVFNILAIQKAIIIVVLFISMKWKTMRKGDLSKEHSISIKHVLEN